MIQRKNLFSFSQKEIDFAFKHAKATRSIRGLKLLVCAGEMADSPLEHGKLLIVTPRKVGKAHDRNKVRRRIKEVFAGQKLYNRNVRSIVLVYKDALKLDFQQIIDFFTKGLS